MEKFSQIFKELYKEKVDNVKQLSKILDISDSLLYKYENGICQPTIDNLVIIANYLDCSINYLVGLDDSPKKTTYNKSYNPSLFIKRYQQLLDDADKSNYSISKKLQITESSYNSWKKGSIPYLDTLIKIADYFGVSIDYLIGRSDKM